MDMLIEYCLDGLLVVIFFDFFDGYYLGWYFYLQVQFFYVVCGLMCLVIYYGVWVILLICVVWILFWVEYEIFMFGEVYMCILFIE